jgi:antitoxin HicB
MNQLVYPLTLTPDERDGGFVVTFVDLPEAITQGDTREDCLREGADALAEAIAARMWANETIPLPSQSKRGQSAVAVPAHIATKAALYMALRETNISNSMLARRLGCDEKEIRRMLDPRHATRLARLEAALAALGKRLVVGVQAA